MSKWVFVNQDFVKEDDAVLKISDLSFMRGYGIFDFMKIRNGQPVYLEDHLERFYFSASKMHLQVPGSKKEFREIIQLLIEKNNLHECGIRFTLTGGYSADGYHQAESNLVISTHPFKLPAPHDINNGIHLMTWPFQRQLPEVKTIDYLMAIWLQPVLHEKNADDILYHNNGVLTECPRANFFMVRDQKLITPSRNILKGITRKKIIEIASLRYDIEERDIHIAELKTASELFICSTTKMILPVRQVDEIILPTERPLTLQLLQLISQFQDALTMPVAEH